MTILGGIRNLRRQILSVLLLTLLGAFVASAQQGVTRQSVLTEIRLIDAINLWKPKNKPARMRSKNPFLKKKPSELRRMRAKSKLASLDKSELLAKLRSMGAPPDGRLDLAELLKSPSQNRNLVNASRSVCTVTLSRSVAAKESFPPLAEGQQFCTQNRTGFATGFIVGSDIVVTAGIPPNTVASDLAFIFDYTDSGNEPYPAIDTEQVYLGAKILKPSTSLEDFALIRVDREFRDRPPLKLCETQARRRQKLDWIGSPHGLPLKVSKGKVLKAKTDNFSAALSLASGNSGSPVFLSGSDEVLGIIVRDNQTFLTAELENELLILNGISQSSPELALPSSGIRQALKALSL